MVACKNSASATKGGAVGIGRIAQIRPLFFSLLIWSWNISCTSLWLLSALLLKTEDCHAESARKGFYPKIKILRTWKPAAQSLWCLPEKRTILQVIPAENFRPHKCPYLCHQALALVLINHSWDASVRLGNSECIPDREIPNKAILTQAVLETQRWGCIFTVKPWAWKWGKQWKRSLTWAPIDAGSCFCAEENAWMWVHILQIQFKLAALWNLEVFLCLFGRNLLDLM